jgi:hypothetical protein
MKSRLILGLIAALLPEDCQAAAPTIQSPDHPTMTTAAPIYRTKDKQEN